MLNIDLAIHSLLQTSQLLNELFACYYITVQYVILSYHLDLPMTASCCATARRPHEDPVLEASYDMNRAGGSRTVIASVSTQLAHGDWCGHSNLHEHHVENIDKQELIWVKLSLIQSSLKSFDDAKGLALQNFGQSWWGAEFKYWTSPKKSWDWRKIQDESCMFNVHQCTNMYHGKIPDVHWCSWMLIKVSCMFSTNQALILEAKCLVKLQEVVEEQPEVWKWSQGIVVGTGCGQVLL